MSRSIPRVLVLLAAAAIAASSCGGLVTQQVPGDAGGDSGPIPSSSSGGGSGSGSSGSSSSTSSSSSSGSSPVIDASTTCPPADVGSNSCNVCISSSCLGPNEWCACSQDPNIVDGGVPGCVAYEQCVLRCLDEGGDADACLPDCGAGYTQQEIGTGDSLYMCIVSECSAMCGLPTMSGSGSGGADTGSDVTVESGADASACDSLTQSACYSCCQTDDAAGAMSFFADVAGCLCMGGPCTTACAGAGDYCATPGNVMTMTCESCVTTNTSAGAVCDTSTGKIAAACAAEPGCTAYLACADGCPGG